MNIEGIDKNFAPTTLVDGVEIEWRDASQAPIELNGFAWFGQERTFCRLPESALPKANAGVQQLAYCSSGGALRFKTDSKQVRIDAMLSSLTDMRHMPRTGSSGFDLYVGTGAEKRFISNISPVSSLANPGINENEDQTSERDRLLQAKRVEGMMKRYVTKKMREYTLYFPLYNGVSSVRVGVEKGSEALSPTPFSIEKPLVFYGASITQGGCASRPGNAFTNILSRWLDVDVVNLGFSGSSRGEPAIAEAINSLDMSALFIDYDQGERDHLRANHERFFKAIREKHPTLPIVIVAKRDPKSGGEEVNVELQQGVDIIRQTYENALNSGDKNVHFINHQALFACDHMDALTVDGVHPNDYGFVTMAKNLLPLLQRVLKA